jgi:phosphatidylglycerol:prolipoprotein diacylglycerol transferase
MDVTELFGAHPEWFGPLMVLAFGAAYVTAAVVGYRRGWPPAAWLLVLAAAGVGGVVGTRLLPLGLDGLRVLLAEGALPESGARRLPGTILGALAAAEVTRRLLGVRRSMLDPLAPAGLVGLAVARVGCLLAGCCFGTPTDLPWGVAYAPGSFVHGFHLAHGVVEAGAQGPAPVHTIPLYDMVFALAGLAFLPRLRRRLRAPGSLCGAVVGLYAVHRFVQDFVRAGEVEVWGGLTAVQVGMAVAAALAFGAVAWAERRERTPGRRGGAAPVEPAALRLVAVLAGVVAVRVGLGEWLTPAESAVLLVRLVPATAAVAFVVVQGAGAARLRWAAAGLAGLLPAVVGFQTEPPPAEPFDVWAVEAHGDLGRYEEFEICSPDLYEYTTAGVGVAKVSVDPAAERTREVGVRVYGGRQRSVARTGRTSPRDDDGGAFGAVHPYVRVEGRNAGVTVGLQAGRLPVLGTETTSPVLPTLGARLGPRRGHLQVGFLDAPHFGAPASALHMGVGTGRLTEDGQELRVTGGISGSGFYVAGTIPAGPLFIEPMGAAAKSDQDWIYQGGVRVRVHLPAP